MTTVNVTEARANLYKLIDDTSVSHEPVVITGKRGNAVLLAEDDWNAITRRNAERIAHGLRRVVDPFAKIFD